MQDPRRQNYGGLNYLYWIKLQDDDFVDKEWRRMRARRAKRRSALLRLTAAAPVEHEFRDTNRPCESGMTAALM
ncbi:hypothetical protein [Burkholderia oklahomensis]|uniref:Uncharacterized protein n=1 Tax=Burkholderia oklahomensis TaxID=342113 RepID=A0AAI8BBP0_9BURK|nr:hypothetical protein [Burkholderia oklahomensis]AIO69203.1 hypothetical protein DM82_5505 [Burkholderia oklahomensis]AJX35238.1 hypothetical protein BG90_5105 [Burkholderia oklahomensis C6786]MBI0363022.1 hypothetical protein [Burkholderia oklahomensis]QPS40552.1 hypothetical protein I6G57_19595 [Burkholderia oklahomensis]SUY27122.1 Uncharacterised protein [Burkholderia oklahomensis]